MAEDLGEKTELPSERKIREARQRGSVARSIDLSGAVDLIGALLIVWFCGSMLVTGFGQLMRRLLAGEGPGVMLDSAEAGRTFGWAMAQGFITAWPVFVAMFLVVVLSHLQQTKLLFTLEPLAPKLERLNPVEGFQRLFSKRSAVKTAVACVKLVIVASVVFLVVRSYSKELAALPNLEAVAAYRFLFRVLVEIAAYILAILLIIGVVDYLYQRWQYTQELKMTKQEVKDERRSTEGDEETKRRTRQLGRQMIMQGIKRDVPKADVIVTNPTHFSVALKYDSDKMAAPRVVAKGADELAFRIRELAIAHGVPIVEKPPLARALYYSAKVGQDVKPEFYQAVAEVLAFVYRLGNNRAKSA